MGLIMEDAIEALADHVIETKLEDIPSFDQPTHSLD